MDSCVSRLILFKVQSCSCVLCGIQTAMTLLLLRLFLRRPSPSRLNWASSISRGSSWGVLNARAFAVEMKRKKRNVKCFSDMGWHWKFAESDRNPWICIWMWHLTAFKMRKMRSSLNHTLLQNSCARSSSSSYILLIYMRYKRPN